MAGGRNVRHIRERERLPELEPLLARRFQRRCLCRAQIEGLLVGALHRTSLSAGSTLTHKIDAVPRNIDSPDPRTAEILRRVRAIPVGFVRTYGDIEPRAPRQVGRVLATTDQR